MRIKLITKPSIDARVAISVGLLDIEMQKCCIDSLGKETVCALLHIDWRARIGRTSRSVRLGPYAALTIDVSTRRSGTILDVAQLADTPELASNLIGATTILQELARESPMAITLQPSGQSVSIAHLLQAAHIFIGHPIGYESTQIPQEAVANLLDRKSVV